MSSFAFPHDWLGDASISLAKWFGKQRASYPNSQVGARAQMERDVLAAQGPQITARTPRPLEWASRAAADALYPGDTATSRDFEESLGGTLETLLGLLSPQGSPASVGGAIPADKIDDIFMSVYNRLTGGKEFRPGTSPTFSIKGNTFFTKLRGDTDADEAQNIAVEKLADLIKAGEVPDEVLMGGEKAIKQHLLNVSKREGLQKLRRRQEQSKEVLYDDFMEDFSDEGSFKGSALENVAAPGFSAGKQGADELAEALSPMAGDVQAAAAASAARTAEEAAAEASLSQILNNIKNPRLRAILKRTGEKPSVLARERFEIPQGVAVPEWMRQEAKRDLNKSQQIARGRAPGMAVSPGARGNAEQWAVVRDALKQKSRNELNALATSRLEGPVRDAAVEYVTRKVTPYDLVRKYRKAGVTDVKQIYEALQKLTYE